MSEERSTGQLLSATAQTRARVASDVEALTAELTPAHLKERALDIAERSAESLAARALRRLVNAPRLLAGLARRHPAATTALGVGLGVAVWRWRAGRS
jgi:hypothetical protein